LLFPRELEDFEKLQEILREWAPTGTIQVKRPPSIVWTNVRVYGIWIVAAASLYAAIGSDSRAIGLPACFVVAVGGTWYFIRCGRKVRERKWRVLLPITGFLMALTLLGKAFVLWVGR
jgi:hypothetical protein